MYSQSFTARLKSCPDTEQCFSVPRRRYSLEVSLGLGELQIPRLPRISCRAWWVSELHAAFFNESRTRGHLWCRVVGNPGPLGMTKERAAVVTVEDSFQGREARTLQTVFFRSL
jgi:hypothetical protein